MARRPRSRVAPTPSTRRCSAQALEKAEAEAAAQKAEKAERLRRKKLADQKRAIEEPARRKRRSLEKARAKLALALSGDRAMMNPLRPSVGKLAKRAAEKARRNERGLPPLHDQVWALEPDSRERARREAQDLLPRPRAPLRPRIAARSPATRIVDGDFDDELVSDEDVVQTVDRTLATYLNAKQDVFSLQARAPEPPPTADVLTAERAPARGLRVPPVTDLAVLPRIV